MLIRQGVPKLPYQILPVDSTLELMLKVLINIFAEMPQKGD